MTSIEKDLTEDLAKIKAYFDDNELVINMNVGKTEVMLFGAAKRIFMQPRPLEVLNNQQLLHLPWTHHWRYVDLEQWLWLIVQKSYNTVEASFKITWPFESRCSLEDFATIVPIITHCLAVQLYLSETQCSMLASIERRSGRVIGT